MIRLSVSYGGLRLNQSFHFSDFASQGLSSHVYQELKHKDSGLRMRRTSEACAGGTKSGTRSAITFRFLDQLISSL